MRIAIVGDPHLSEGFRCRKDNYLESVLDKISYIAKNNDKVIFLGDLFDRCANSTLFFNTIYKFFSQDKYKGVFISCLGNHDVAYRTNNLMRTTIGSLELTGVLTIARESFTIDGYDFDVSPVVKDMSKLGDSTNTKILLAHNYIEMPHCEEESFTRDEIIKMNYNAIYAGHEHCPYEPELIGKTMLYRPGSLSRIDTQLYNKTRKIYYCQLDTEIGECIKREVPSKPIKECYVDGAFDKSPIKQKSVYGGLSALLSKFDNNVDKKENMSLPTVLRTMKASEAHITYLREIHRDNNIGFD